MINLKPSFQHCSAHSEITLQQKPEISEGTAGALATGPLQNTWPGQLPNCRLPIHRCRCLFLALLMSCPYCVASSWHLLWFVLSSHLAIGGHGKTFRLDRWVASWSRDQKRGYGMHVVQCLEGFSICWWKPLMKWLPNDLLAYIYWLTTWKDTPWMMFLAFKAG